MAEQEHESYEEWKAWAQAEDRRTGADAWKDVEESPLYDNEIIRLRYDDLVDVRRSGQADRLVYYLNEGLHGNMGGMGSPALYAEARFGTKTLITLYIDEIVAALHDLEALGAAELDPREKRALLRRARDCFGRSAFMLSGAGTLGAFHLGVTKALAEHDLVPNVVSGASAGSIIAAIIGTQAAADLSRVLSEDAIELHFDLLRGPESRRDDRRRIQVDDLRAMIEAAIPDMTFIEAYEETGREINVAVAPARLHQRSRLLNASTAPNVFIREAVMASCAVPQVFPPVTLAAKDKDGRRRPYVPARQWVDGSITDDLPARRLARLYSINHFISSQANPLVLWASRDPHAPEGLMSRLAGIYFSASQDWLRTLYPFTMDLVGGLDPVGTYTRLAFSVLTQDYGADVNIVPSRRFFDPRMILSPLSLEEAGELMRDGERATWSKIEIIRNCTRVSRCLEALLKRMEEGGVGGDAATA